MTLQFPFKSVADLIVKVTTVGTLSRSLPTGKDMIEGESFTVQDVLDSLLKKHGQTMADELLSDGEFKKGFSLLVNGRNVLSLPNKFETLLKDGDELIIATMLAGG
jgi:molybdopterin converting factor small subunit